MTRKQEIENQIATVTAAQRTNSKLIDKLRQERAKLSVENANKNQQKISKIDDEMLKLRVAIENYPSELKLLEENLAAENQRIAQAEMDKLLEQQQEISDEVTLLSKGFVAILKKANDINTQLIAALTAETNLAQKTGQQVLTEYCHGSIDSLRMLLERMEAQLDGQHTQLVGAGIVGSNTQIRL